MDYSKQRDKKIILKEKSKTSLIDIRKITHIKCDGHISTIYTINNVNISVSKLLKHFESELAEFGFIRVNHNTIVNTMNIIDYCNNCMKNKFIRKIVLINNVEINISRRKMHVLQDFFLKIDQKGAI